MKSLWPWCLSSNNAGFSTVVPPGAKVATQCLCVQQLHRRLVSLKCLKCLIHLVISQGFMTFLYVFITWLANQNNCFMFHRIETPLPLFKFDVVSHLEPGEFLEYGCGPPIVYGKIDPFYDLRVVGMPKYHTAWCKKAPDLFGWFLKNKNETGQQSWVVFCWLPKKWIHKKRATRTASARWHGGRNSVANFRAAAGRVASQAAAKWDNFVSFFFWTSLKSFVWVKNKWNILKTHMENKKSVI